MQIKSSKKMPLLELLASIAPDSSKNTLRSWIDKGRVTINGKLAKNPKQEIEPGQEVTVGSKPKFLYRDITVIFEDEDLVVIDKPAGLLSVAKDVDIEVSAHSILKRRFNNRRVFPIHRLDKDTSGLLVFAYSEKAYRGLKEQLEKRTMYREYRALVRGHPGKGTWRSHLKENGQMYVHSCDEDDGKIAVTHFETVRQQGPNSLLKLRLESGRKHQIRVQAADAGFPIVGDSKYGIEEDAKRPFKLRAVRLAFTHPISQKEMEFSGKFSLL